MNFLRTNMHQIISIMKLKIIGTIRPIREELENGKHNGTNIIKYSFEIIHKELGIVYDLRGGYAAKSLRNGVGIRAVADFLGHSKIEAIYNYYVSYPDEILKKANEKFGQAVKSNVIDEIIKYE